MDKPVLIIGAGVVGLSLAHGLKKVHPTHSLICAFSLLRQGESETFR